MNLLEAIHALFPALGIIILFFGIYLQRKNYFIGALWLSLIALILHYRASGGEILGSYFNYYHAIVYIVNLIILTISMGYLLWTSIQKFPPKILRSSIILLLAVFITSEVLLAINLGVNAIFIGNRLPNTPILQVAMFSKQPYCSYKYIFYKVDSDSQVKYMCPNYYGLLPSVGPLAHAPNFLIKQLPPKLQAKFQKNSEPS